MNPPYKYYARTSGVEIWELYRCPKNELPLFNQLIHEIQKANRYNLWMPVENLQGLWEENLTGWFDESNAISEEKANTVLKSWNLLNK